MIQGRKYSIEWLDTFGFTGWFDAEDLKEKAKELSYSQKTVGFFAGEDRNWIILAAHNNPHKDFRQWGHPTWIPKRSIKRIRELK